jgi:hypothetical protein
MQIQVLTKSRLYFTRKCRPSYKKIIQKLAAESRRRKQKPLAPLKRVATTPADHLRFIEKRSKKRGTPSAATRASTAGIAAQGKAPLEEDVDRNFGVKKGVDAKQARRRETLPSPSTPRLLRAYAESGWIWTPPALFLYRPRRIGLIHLRFHHANTVRAFTAPPATSSTEANRLCNNFRSFFSTPGPNAFMFSQESVFPDSYFPFALRPSAAKRPFDFVCLFVCLFVSALGSLRASAADRSHRGFIQRDNTFYRHTDCCDSGRYLVARAGGSSKRQDESSERGLSLNRSQRGNCSTEYNTPLGT